MVLFFTLPPSWIPYPFVLINAHRPERGLSYLAKHGRAVQAVIVDSGVEIFRNPNVKDYPGGSEAWIARLVRLYSSVRALAPNATVYVTCPDMPDDYNPGSLWLSEKVTNIERTAENVRLCTSRYPSVGWLIPIQGHHRDPSSLLTSIEYYWNMGVFDRYSYFAVANLCVEVDVDLIHRSVLAVRKRLRELGVLDRVRLHIFGLKIAALRKVRELIHSFDSMSWTRPVDSYAYRIRNASAKNEQERTVFFCRYVWRLLKHYGVEIPAETLYRCAGIGGKA